jgi:hypothetical protein
MAATVAPDPFSFGAIQCDIEVLTAAFLATDASAFGGTQRKKDRYWRIVKRVRRTFDLPPEPGDQLGRRRVKPRTTVRNLKRFAKKIDRLIRRQIATQAEVGLLGDMARDLIQKVNQFLVNAPQP